MGAAAASLHPRLQRIFGHGTGRPGLGRRGAVAALLAVASTVLVGVAGFAVDVGSWYMSRRNADTAAEFAAMAGAQAITLGQSGAAAASDVAARNGFTTGGTTTVTVNTPPISGAQAGNAAAVEVIITQVPGLTLTRVLLATAPTLRSRAVAAAVPDDPVCLLALGAGLDLGNRTVTAATRCALASNGTATDAILVTGPVRAKTLYTAGGCANCTGAAADVWTDDSRSQRPMVAVNRARPVDDPYAGLPQGGALTALAPRACLDPNINLGNNAPPISPDRAICTSITVGTGQTLTFNPGVYFFRNADLTVQGTVGVTGGGGVTLVFYSETSNPPGRLTITDKARGTLRAPGTTPFAGYPQGAGLLAYRDASAAPTSGTTHVDITADRLVLIGGLYFPTSNIRVNGNAGGGATCFQAIGYDVQAANDADTRVDVSGCSGFTPVARLLAVRLVE